MNTIEQPLCACGCGEQLPPPKYWKQNLYIFGHANKATGKNRQGTKTKPRVIQAKCGGKKRGRLLRQFALCQGDGTHVAGERRVR